MSIRPEHRKKFPRGRIAETLLMFIRLRGGSHASVNSEFVFGPLADYFGLSEPDRKLPRCAYYDNDPMVGSAWDNEVKLACRALKEEGYVISTTRSGQLLWRLTIKGTERADFWLVRMTDKRNALQALVVDPQLAWTDTGNRTKRLESH